MKSLKHWCAVATVGLVLMGGVGRAETIQLVLGGDATLAEALAAYDAAHSAAYVDTDGGASLGANAIEVSGSGTLTFSTALGSWTGDLTVKPGAKVRAICGVTSAVLGNAATGAVRVESGAALVNDYSTHVGSYADEITRPIHIAGDGQAAGEHGALKLIVNNSSFRAAVPMSLFLDDDATVCFGSANPSWSQDHQVIMDCGETWNLGGHVLTLSKAGWTKTSTPTFFYGANVKGGGHVVQDGVIALFRNAAFEGGAENTFTFRNGAYGWLQGFTSPAWTLKVEDTASGKWNWGLSQNWSLTAAGLRTWAGPVEIAQAVDMTDTTDFDNVYGFAGKVTGAGGLVVGGASSADRSRKRFNLLGAGSDFAGGLDVTGYTVHLGAPDAVPSGAGAGPLTLTDADVLFDYDARTTADFVLPATTFNGSGAIKSDLEAFPQGRFRSLTKNGAGTLEITAALTGGDVTVNAGTLRLKQVPFLANAGFYAGKSSKQLGVSANAFASTSFATPLGYPDKMFKDVMPYLLYSNEVVQTPSIFFTPVGTDAEKSAWEKAYYQRLITYSGFVRNTGDTKRTMRMICTLNAYVRVRIGENEYNTSTEPARTVAADGGRGAPLLDCTVDIPVGVSRVEIRIYDRYGLASVIDGASGLAFCFGNVRTRGLANWDDAHGLMLSDDLQSKDMNDFRVFGASGDGLEFAKDDRCVEEWTVDRLAGGGTVDLCGGTLHVGTVAGSLQILNGTVQVEGTMSLSDGRVSLSGAAASREMAHGLKTGMSSRLNGMYSHPTECTVLYPDAPYQESMIKDVIPSVLLGGDTTDYLKVFASTVRVNAQGVRQTWEYYQRYVTYDGFVWNNSAEPVTWKVVSTCNAYVWVTIGDKMVYNTKLYDGRVGGVTPPEYLVAAHDPLLTDTFTLQPGANRLVVQLADRFGVDSMLYGNVCTNGLKGWTDGHGLMWSEKLDATDMSDFHEFRDAGDGALLTRCLVDPATSVTYAKLSGVAGTEIDFGGPCEANVRSFEGAAKSVGGLVRVLENWTMTASQIMDASACLDGVAFGADVTFGLAAGESVGALRPTSRGHLIAKNVVGTTVPTLGAALAEAGWTIGLKDGELRLFNPGGLILIVR